MPKKAAAKKSLPKTFQGMKVPTGQEVYDGIMKRIEPELVTANLKKLDAPYKKEKPAARAARYKGYAKSFKVYKKAYKTWASNLKKAAQNYKKVLLKTTEVINRKGDDAALKSLESQMQSA